MLHAVGAGLPRDKYVMQSEIAGIAGRTARSVGPVRFNSAQARFGAISVDKRSLAFPPAFPSGGICFARSSPEHGLQLLKISPRICVIRFQAQGLFELNARLGPTFETRICHAEVVMRLGIAGISFTAAE